MSREVDERIVQMRFENQQFETGIRETRRSLDALRQSLSFDGVGSKGLEFLGEKVSAVSEHFSAMGIMADRVLERLADKAFDTGTRIAKALTIQGADDGFKEYELKMGSVQTIMNGSGASLEKVNEVLENLNVYADKTIYSFSDMTSSIGKFTNAGVELDDAVKAIQGISNEAALSGANANEASRAMYNFAQALSSGVVRLIDWKSIENANMATKEFKNELIQTAVEVGTLTKQGDQYVSTTTDMNGHTSEAFDAVSKFNDSLSAQWMTSEVLIKTLGRYADETTNLGKRAFAAAQEVKTFSQLLDTLKEAVGSGWAQSFEIIVGDFGEAKKLWTGVNNALSAIVDGQAKARNELLQGWKDLGGRDNLIHAFANMWGSLRGYIQPVKEAFDDVFSPIGPKRLAGLTEQFNEFTARLRLSDTAMENLRSTFHGIFAVADMGKDALSAFVAVLKPYSSVLTNVGGRFLDTAGKLGTWVSTIRDSTKESGFFYQKLSGISNVFKKVVTNFQLSDKTVEKLHNTFSGLFSIIDLVRQMFSGLFRIIAERSGTFEDFQNGIFGFAGILGSIEDKALSVTGWLGQLITNLTNSAKESDFFYQTFGKVADILSSGFGIFHDLLEFVKSHLPSMEEFRTTLSGIKEKAEPLEAIFSKAAEAVGGFFSSFRDGEKKLGFFEKLSGFLASVWSILSKVGTFLSGAFINGFSYLGDVVANFDSSKLLDFVAAGSLFSAAGGVIGFIQNLKETVTGFGDILGSVKNVLDGVTGTLEAMQMKVKAGVIATIAGAVVGLALALAVIAALDTEGLNQALLAIGALFGYLGTTFTVLGKLFDGKNLNGLKQASSAMTGMAVSVAILAASMLMLKDFSWADIGRSLTAVGLLMAGLVVSAKVLSENKDGMMKGAAGLIFFAAGIRILTGALKTVKDLSWEELLKDLTAVGVLIAGVAVAINFTNFSGFGVSQGIGILAMAAGLKVLSGVIIAFSNLKTEDLVKGLAAFVATIASLTIALNFMPKNLPLLGIGMILFASALLTISGALAILSLINSEALARGVAVLGIALAEFVIATMLMKNAVPGALAMLVMAGAVAVLVPALMLLSAISWGGILKGFVTISGMFAIFGVAGLTLAPVVPVILALAGALTLIGIATLAAGAGLTMIGAALASFGVGAAAAAASVGAAITIIAVDIVKLIPTVLVAIGRGLIQMIAVLGDGVEAVGIVVIKIGLAILNAVEILIPKVVEVGFTLILAILHGIEEGLPKIVDAAFNVVVSFVNALAEAVRGNDRALLAAIGNLISSIAELLLSALQMIVKDIPVFGDQMVQALEDGKEKIRKFFTPADFDKLGKDAAAALGGSFSSSGKIGDAADEMAKDGLRTFSSYTPDFESIGDGWAQTLGEGFSGSGSLNNLFGDASSTFGDISPNIRPVLDMSDLETSAAGTNGMFADSTLTFNGYDDMMSELNSLSLGMDHYHLDNQNLAEAVDGLHTDNETQNEKLDSMGKSLDEYLPYLKKFDGLQVVMDSGELVGSIRDPLDRELGLAAARSIRSGKM